MTIYFKHIGEYPALPKWPALIVRGEPVSKEIAAQILIRCNSWGFSCNDKEWVHMVENVCGVPKDDYSAPILVRDERWKIITDFTRKIGIIHLSYLETDRIMSSWIGGPHGWCDWSGSIGSNNYNIGKWPSVSSVFEDWHRIATAFPMLNLRSQLMSGETSEDNNIPLVEFEVKNGNVDVYKPDKLLDAPVDAPIRNLLDRTTERGCTIEKLKWAIDLTIQANLQTT